MSTPQSPCKDQVGTVTIIQGEDKTFYLSLYMLDSGDPFDLTGVTEIKVAFPSLVGPTAPIVETKTSGAVSIFGSAGSGKIQINIPKADTALMNASSDNPLQDLQINITTGDAKTVIFLMPAALNIKPASYTVS